MVGMGRRWKIRQRAKYLVVNKNTYTHLRWQAMKKAAARQTFSRKMARGTPFPNGKHAPEVFLPTTRTHTETGASIWTPGHLINLILASPYYLPRCHGIPDISRISYRVPRTHAPCALSPRMMLYMQLAKGWQRRPPSTSVLRTRITPCARLETIPDTSSTRPGTNEERPC